MKGVVISWHIIAIILATMVLAVAAYWVYKNSAWFQEQLSDAECNAKKMQYCVLKPGGDTSERGFLEFTDNKCKDFVDKSKFTNKNNICE